ncbi:hypothetical protein BdWA1_003353 [Babesia duncani]|uniref:Uncharacterized protein n=1 Tax=Babesia duncani TaxID=323732 RepID=A0AAD9UMI6_9APIC|nr:hypothetical protein BdWA1_003353 [Babesia duncani]
MTVIGLAFTFVFYPVICPILTVESSRHHTIILWALLIEFSSGVMVFLLTVYADIRWRWVESTEKTGGGKFKRQYYNLLWLFLVPFLGFGLAFLWALHHPNSGFSNALRYGFLGGVLTCVYYISAENTTNVGFACMFHHAFQGAGGKYQKEGDQEDPNKGLDFTDKDFKKANKAAGYVMTFAVFVNNFFSVYFLYLMDAHLSNFFMYTVCYHHVFTFEHYLGLDGAGGLYRKYVQLGKGGNELDTLIGELVNTDGTLKNFTGTKEVTAALKDSGLPSHYHSVYAKAFKEVFNKVKEYGATELEESGKLKETAKEKIKDNNLNIVFNDAGLNHLSPVQKKEFKSACAQAYFDAYNTAVEVDSGLDVNSGDESTIKQKLNDALSKKSLRLSDVQVDAYAKAAFAKNTSDDEAKKKSGRKAVGAVAAAELAGNIACAGPGDAPILVRNLSDNKTVKFEDKHGAAAIGTPSQVTQETFRGDVFIRLI